MSANFEYLRHDPFKAREKVSAHRDRIAKALEAGSQSVSDVTGSTLQSQTGIKLPGYLSSDLQGPDVTSPSLQMTQRGGQGQATTASGGQAASSSGGVNPQFKNALDRFLAASGGQISIGGRAGAYGYRSYEQQVDIFNKAVKKYGSPAAARKWAAPPGKSKHNVGMAADLQFKTPAARAWAHANARKYGLYFPMKHEPWHVEPVGSR